MADSIPNVASSSLVWLSPDVARQIEASRYICFIILGVSNFVLYFLNVHLEVVRLMTSVCRFGYASLLRPFEEISTSGKELEALGLMLSM